MSLPEIIMLTDSPYLDKSKKIEYESVEHSGSIIAMRRFILRPGCYIMGGYDPLTDTVIISSDDSILREDKMVRGITALYIQFILSMPEKCW